MVTRSHPKASRSSSESAMTGSRLPHGTLKRRKKALTRKVSDVTQNRAIFSYFTKKLIAQTGSICVLEEKKANEEEAEQEEESHSDEKKSKKKKGEESFGQRMANLYMDPNGSPKPEAWMTLLAALACGYVAITTEAPRKEIVFMTFLNDYLLKN